MSRNNKSYYRKTVKELHKGDIIRMFIPFEENTPDYYNGYSPESIRGGPYVDRNGQTGKVRYAIVIGHEFDSIQYLPLTSRHTRFDTFHQYELQDNSMTYRKDPNMKSYVEVNSLRSVYVDSKWKITVQGQIAEADMANIMVKLGKHRIDFESDRDQRVYVSKSNNERFEKKIEENGYLFVEENAAYKEWENPDGKTITKTRWGLVKYHVPLSKEEVTELVAKHEGKPMDDFSRAVAAISRMESEVTK